MAQLGRASRWAGTWRDELMSEADIAHGERGWREATWAAQLSFDKDKQLKVAMNGLNMTDEGIKEWSTWFLQYSATLGHGHTALRATLVDFAENQLTSAGAATLLKTFSTCGISVYVLKLHHNLIKEAGCFADYFRTCDGCLQELHLSHNSLDAKASAVIVAAAASAKGEDGMPCYPRRSGARGSVPLWLRLEKNNIDDGEFSAIMDGTMTNQLCSARSKWCTPHCCAAKVPPAVHAKNLGNQRRQTDAAEQDDSAASGEFFLKLLAKSAQPVSGDTETKECTMADTASNVATGSDSALPEGWERAEIERWDPDVGRWLRGVIDIPPAVEPRSSLPKAQQEKLTMGLKALIGIGQRSDGDMEMLNGLEGVTPAVSSKQGSKSRRASQPSVANARQAQQAPNLMRLLREEGFRIREAAAPGLNPQAPEFRPTPKAIRPAKGQAKAKDGRARAARETWNRYPLATSSATSAEDALDLSATRFLSAGLRDPEPLKVALPAEMQFGKDSLNECAESTGVESNAAAWSVRKDSSIKEDDETQDASSGVDDVTSTTSAAVETADSTEDTMGPEMSKSETGKSIRQYNAV